MLSKNSLISKGSHESASTVIVFVFYFYEKIHLILQIINSSNITKRRLIALSVNTTCFLTCIWGYSVIVISDHFKQLPLSIVIVFYFYEGIHLILSTYIKCQYNMWPYLYLRLFGYCNQWSHWAASTAIVIVFYFYQGSHLLYHHQTS